MSGGHDSILSPNLHYAAGPAARQPISSPLDSHALDTSGQKRRRDGNNWDAQGTSTSDSKRVRRADDLDQHDPTSLYDPQLNSHHFANSNSNSSSAGTYPATQAPFAAASSSSPFAAHTLDPAANQSYAPAAPTSHQQYRDQDSSFGAYQSQGPSPNDAFGNPWGMPSQQPNQSRAFQSSPDQFFAQTNDYAPTNMQSQPPYSTSISAQDWTQPSYSYTGGTEHWNYQIDEPTVYGDDASLHLKIQSLPTLDNLSTQIIMNLAKGSLPDILLLTAGRNYEESQAYFTRRTLFDQTRKVFTRSSVFIDCSSMPNVFTASQQEVIRKANRATFISSILEGHDISFYDLDARFLDTFVSTGQRLLKWQGSIFLELKTQAYIAALMNNDAPPDVLLHELFPHDLEQRILARHPDAANITPGEQDFLDRARARRQYLADEPPYEALGTLRHKYGWQEFLREFAVCINKNLESIINNPARTPSSSSFSPRVSRLSQSPANRYPYYGDQMAQQRMPLIAQQSLGPPKTSQPVSTPTNPQIQNLQQQEARATISATPERADSEASPLAKSKPAKSTKATGGTGTPRQPWKQEEEEALLAGLAEVKGPHWSQILSLYGRGGSVSEVLKDRNQIQLKDKARNLKLWYLKMGNEVPICLRGVTGELRKRGGARVRAALGLTDDDEATPKKKTASPLANKGKKPESQIDPSLE